MILTVIAVILTALILMRIGILKGKGGLIKDVAIGAAIFFLIKGLIKVVSPFAAIAYGIIGFDFIIWAGMHVFGNNPDYAMCTVRLAKALIFNQPY